MLSLRRLCELIAQRSRAAVLLPVAVAGCSPLPLLDAIASNDAAELNRPQLSTARAALLDFVTNVTNALKMLPYAYVPSLARPAGNAHRLADNYDLGTVDLNREAAAALAAATDEAMDPVPLVAALQRVWTLSAYAGIAPPA